MPKEQNKKLKKWHKILKKGPIRWPKWDVYETNEFKYETKAIHYKKSTVVSWEFVCYMAKRLEICMKPSKKEIKSVSKPKTHFAVCELKMLKGNGLQCVVAATFSDHRFIPPTSKFLTLKHCATSSLCLLQFCVSWEGSGIQVWD